MVLQFSTILKYLFEVWLRRLKLSFRTPFYYSPWYLFEILEGTDSHYSK